MYMFRSLCRAAALLACALPCGASALPSSLSFPALDLDKLAREDAVTDDVSGLPRRFAVARVVDANPDNAGQWTQAPDGRWHWRLPVHAVGAAHLNFGFSRFALPEGASLRIVSKATSAALGPYTRADELPHGQLWTAVLPGDSAIILLDVPAEARDAVALQLKAVNQGYRGFGTRSKACKSGSCNTDVACLSPGDPWNLPRRAVGAITVNGGDTCTGSLLNNTAQDRRMLFATATHCGIANDSAAASVVVYWNYESPTCRVPGSSESGNALPKPASTTPGLRFLAQTANPFDGTAPAGDRSDFTLIELATPAANNTFNLYWAGWDRRPPSGTEMTCAAPGDPSSTLGLCASIHHPSVDEKRITFVETNLTLSNISSAQGVHWLANWDQTPPRLPNISPMPGTLPPSVTEPGSSGSPLYNAQQRLVGVLSGGASACGVAPSRLNDQYGGLFHAWEGLGTAATRMRDHLDPLGTAPSFIDGLDTCDAPAAPAGLTLGTPAANTIGLSWSAVSGVSRYRVERRVGDCSGSDFSPLTEVDGSTAFSDASVSGGIRYAYRVVSIGDTGCTSPPGSCQTVQATGSCTAPPSFAGLGSATSSGMPTCSVDLAWSAATAQCGGPGDLRYNVYRGSAPDFVPASGNRVASCLTGVSLQQAGGSNGVTDYYVVRAEDIGADGSGVCGGSEELNLVRRAVAPFGPRNVLFSDDAEGGDAGWTTQGSGAGSNFARVTSAAASPTRSWFVPNPTQVADRSLTLAASVSADGVERILLNFQHRVSLESGFDGGVLEYSLDGGSTWTDILAAQGGVGANAARVLTGGYTASISSSYGNPLAGRNAWSGNAGTFSPVEVDLTDFSGRSMLLRFRMGSDSSIALTGWWIDDIRIETENRCGSAPDGRIFADGFEAP